MSPSVRFLGTDQRVDAILSHRAIYEIGRELEVEHAVGRPPTHPAYVLLAFAVLGRMNRSTVRVETDLLDSACWDAVRRRMETTIARHQIDLPAPSSRPPAWHHWRRFRDEHLVTDQGLNRLRSLHMEWAVALAHDLGLLRQRYPESLTHPSRERVIYGDGTIVRPIYAPPAAVRITDADGAEVVRYPSTKTGELHEEPQRR